MGKVRIKKENGQGHRTDINCMGDGGGVVVKK